MSTYEILDDAEQYLVLTQVAYSSSCFLRLLRARIDEELGLWRRVRFLERYAGRA